MILSTKQIRKHYNRTTAISTLILSAIFIIISLVSFLSFFVIIGVALLFWGVTIFYMVPPKHVPTTMLYAEAEVNARNIELIINKSKKFQSGIYLPPRTIKNMESSLVFIPPDPNETDLFADETTNSLTNNPKDYTLIVPPGAGFCRLFENELNSSFEKWDLKQLQTKLPKLLIEDLDLVENIEIQIQENTATIDINGSILDEFCRYMDTQPRTHKQVGCILSSAIACALAKASGKFIIIQNETRNQQAKTTHIEYQISEGENLQLPSFALTETNDLPNERNIKTSLSENIGENTLNIQIDPNALNYLRKKGEVFILADIENPQYSYKKIKGYNGNAKLEIKFIEFVDICQAQYISQTEANYSKTELTTKLFDVNSPAKTKDYDLAYYVAKSGYATVDDWLNTIKAPDENLEDSTKHNKSLCLYHIQTTTLE